MFIRVDKNNIIQDMASREDNLNIALKDLAMYEVDDDSYRPGDRLDSIEEYISEIPFSKEPINKKRITFTPMPENYPQSSEKDLNEQKIQEEMRTLAIKSLKEKGVLPVNYDEVSKR